MRPSLEPWVERRWVSSGCMTTDSREQSRVNNPWFPPIPRAGGANPTVAVAAIIMTAGFATIVCLIWFPWWAPVAVGFIATIGIGVTVHDLRHRRSAWRLGEIVPGMLVPAATQSGDPSVGAALLMGFAGASELTVLPAAALSWSFPEPRFLMKKRAVRVLRSDKLIETSAYFSGQQLPPEANALVWVVVHDNTVWLLATVAPAAWANEPMHESDARALRQAFALSWEGSPQNKSRTAQAVLNRKSEIQNPKSVSGL